MNLTNSRPRMWTMLPAALAVSLVLAACGGDDGDDGGATAPGGDDDGGDAPAEDFKVGMATGGHGVDWMDGQGEVAAALAAARGWEYVELSNEGEGPRAVQNADLFVQEGVDVVIMFQGDITVNEAIADRLAGADIPAITYDIDHESWYFVGIDNVLAGQLGGEALGQLAADEWDCDADLVIRSEATEIGVVNEWRVGGMLDGLLSVCPDIPEDNIVSMQSDGLEEVAQQNGRDLLAANPAAERILVIGINDESVQGVLQAAEQLGRDDMIMGWGQGLSSLGEDSHPGLRGSVAYFLEGYATYAFEGIIDKLAAGEDVPVRDAADDPTVRVEPCLVSAEEAASIPGMAERIEALADAPEGTHLNDLFCPGG